jgi:hypothetical protein
MNEMWDLKSPEAPRQERQARRGGTVFGNQATNEISCSEGVFEGCEYCMGTGN